MTDDDTFRVDLRRDWRIFANPLDGFEMLGVVCEGKWDIGALARELATGLYVLINGGAVKVLDQTQAAAALARARSASGPHT